MSQAEATTDHDEIRRWAEARGGQPSRVKGTAGPGEHDGLLRFDFGEPEANFERIPWEEFFEIFEANGLALLHQDETASGATSRFGRFVARGAGASKGKPKAARSKVGGGAKGKAAEGKPKAAEPKAAKPTAKSPAEDESPAKGKPPAKAAAKDAAPAPAKAEAPKGKAAKPAAAKPAPAKSEPAEPAPDEHLAPGEAVATTDHTVIRAWAEARGGRPSRVKGTAGTGSRGGEDDVGLIRFDFGEPEANFEEIPWEEFFEAFEANGLALLHQDETKGGAPSRFGKFIARKGGAKGVEIKAGKGKPAKGDKPAAKTKAAKEPKTKDKAPKAKDTKGKGAAKDEPSKGKAKAPKPPKAPKPSAELAKALRAYRALSKPDARAFRAEIGDA